MSPRTRACGALCLLLLAVAGCAPWASEPAKPPKGLPLPRLPRDAVVLEAWFLPVPPGGDELLADVWRELDEQHLSLELRRRLQENGIRSGLAGNLLPETIRQWIDQQREKAESSQPGGGSLVSDEMLPVQHRIQSRPGQRYPLTASHELKDIQVLVREEGGVRGQSCQQASCLFAIRTYSEPQGRVRVELTPEIEHGQPRQRMVGKHDQGIFRFDSAREQLVFDHLRVEALLGPGQTLVLGATPGPKGIGKHFFTVDSADGLQSRLLLVRLAQTQTDPLYDPPPAMRPLPLATRAD